MRKTVVAAVVMVFATGGAMGMEGPSAGLGKTVFESPALGTNGKSCASCHPGGKGLKQIDAYSDERLRGIVNACIRDALAGEPLEPGTQELESLLLYLRDLKR